MKGFSLILLLYLPFHLLAQSISLELSHDEVEVGESFMVNITVEGKPDDLVLPAFKAFDILQTGTSSNVQMYNGRVSRSTTYSYTLQAFSPGIYEIPPAIMKINGKSIKSPVASIKVKDSRNGGASGNASSGSMQGSMKGSWKDNILAIAESDKLKAYVGEQITLTYKLLMRINYKNMDVDKAPVFKGFLAEELEIPEDQSVSEMTYKGQRYVSQAFRRTALFGTYPGNFTIEPLYLKGVILIPEQYPFMGSNAIMNPKAVLLPTNKVNIQILPLPEQGKPEGFSGLVGKFDAVRELQSNDIVQGQAVTLQYTIAGKGNLKATVFPDFNYPDAVDAFEPESEFTSKVFDDYALGGMRAFKQSLVFDQPGNYTIPEYAFSYFDPQLAQYVIQQLPAMDITVREGAAADVSSSGKNDGKTFDQSIRKGFDKEEKSLNWALWGVVMGFPVLLMGALSFILAFRKRNVPVETKDDSTWPDITSLQGKEQYALLAKTFRKQLAQAFHLPEQSNDKDLLNSFNDRSLALKAEYILAICDRAVYSPLTAESAADLMAQAKSVWHQLHSSPENTTVS
jgi:hypothetical protein